MTSDFRYAMTDVDLTACDFLPVLVPAEDTFLEAEFWGCTEISKLGNPLAVTSQSSSVLRRRSLQPLCL